MRELGRMEQSPAPTQPSYCLSADFHHLAQGERGQYVPIALVRGLTGM